MTERHAASAPAPVVSRTPAQTSGEKSLKDQNRPYLWAIVSANAVVFYAVVQFHSLELDGLKSVVTEWGNLVSVGLAFALTTVLNGLISAENKARLVFLRWNYALPGHRVFTQYAPSDPRIGCAALTRLHGPPLPVSPEEQNRLWYRFYRSVARETAVVQVHRDFLLTRDYAGLSAVFLVVFGSTGFFIIEPVRLWVIYLALLVCQLLLARHAAATYGVRTATTVLAVTASDHSG
jgi:hypothetical protein